MTTAQVEPAAVLIVEDDEAQRRTLEDLLGDEGYRPVPCRNVQDALALIVREEFAAANMGRMRQAAMAFGVVPDTIGGVEARYLALIALLDQHFERWPYLLGGRPSIGDFSLIAPFYGHLGRDPKPLSLMQSKAVHLFRWVERMNRPEPDCGEFAGDGAARATLRLYADRMARALASVINILDPDLVVLGGGLSKLVSLYDDVPGLWGAYVFSDRVDTPLVPPKHGDASGVRGAAWLWPASSHPSRYHWKRSRVSAGDCGYWFIMM